MRLGRLASNKPRREPLDPMQNFYRTSEGRWFVVNPRGAADWPRIAKAAGLEHLIKDELFATPKARRTNSAALVALRVPEATQLWSRISARRRVGPTTP